MTQEFLYVVHKAQKVVDPSANVLFRNSTALPQETKMPKSGANAKEKPPTERPKEKKDMADFQEAGFENEKQLINF